MTSKISRRTEQEDFWAGDFGTAYIARNQGDEILASNLHFFSQALSKTSQLKTCCEFGANIGMNLNALKLLIPNLELFGVEINKNAALQLGKLISQENVFNCSINEFQTHQKFDLCLIKGVLIHLNPNDLEIAYKKIYEHAASYIVIAEYYNPTPVEVLYRGEKNRLFKRDFAGEFLELFPDVQLIDYGFKYHRDPIFPQDDISWFLLKK